MISLVTKTEVTLLLEKTQLSYKAPLMPKKKQAVCGEHALFGFARRRSADPDAQPRDWLAGLNGRGSEQHRARAERCR